GGSPDGQLLATGGSLRTIQIVNLATGALAATIPSQDAPVAFSPDGRTLATCGIVRQWRGDHGHPRDVTLWDVPDRKERCRLRVGQSTIGSLAFSPDGRLLATGSDGGVI